MADVGNLPDRVWLVEMSTAGQSLPEVAFTLEEAEGFEHTAEYVRRAEISELARRADRYERQAARFLQNVSNGSFKTATAAALAQAAATLALSLRTADAASWLESIRDDGVGVG